MNNHLGSQLMYAFVGLNRNKGGQGPTLFSINKLTNAVQNLGPLFGAADPMSWATGEGWYFSATKPTTLYYNNDSVLYRYDVLTHAKEMIFDAKTNFGSDKYIWQIHSSNDDRVHSFTLRQENTWAVLGCAAYHEDTKTYQYFPAKGDFDECQIDKSGRWLVIKENVDGIAGEDNVIEDLSTGAEKILYDQNGAAGHSDMGFGTMVAEDNWNTFPGAVRRWQMDRAFDAPGNGMLVNHATDWNFGSNHIAYGNAIADNTQPQYVCSSNASRLPIPRANEVICYRLDSSMDTLIVAPIMTNMDAAGGGSDDYSKLPKGNLDISGQFFMWSSNLGGDRLDVFIAKVPANQLGFTLVDTTATGATGGTTGGGTTGGGTTGGGTTGGGTTGGGTTGGGTTGGGTTGGTTSGTPVTWIALKNAATSGDVLMKTTGCAGCPDGLGRSLALLTQTQTFSFVADSTSPLEFVGLTNTVYVSSGNDLTYAFRVQGGRAEAREFGTYVADTAVTPGATLSVIVTPSSVSYAKNGVVFYTHNVRTPVSFAAQAVFYDPGSQIHGAQFVGVTSTSGSGKKK
jgi:hypothetical protein